MTNDYVKAHLT